MVGDDDMLVIPGQRAAELALDIHETHQYVWVKYYLDLGFAGDESLGEVKPGDASQLEPEKRKYDMKEVAK